MVEEIGAADSTTMLWSARECDTDATEEESREVGGALAECTVVCDDDTTEADPE